MKFSVAIPAYKSQFLPEAIESVLNQTYGDFELIITDDCSPENLESIVGKFKDSRIHYIRNGKNCGAVNVVDNWNICLSHCSGDYVICMGDDDRLLPECLAEYDKLMALFPGLSVYHAWTEIIDENGQFVSLTEPRPEYESALSMLINRWAGREQFIGDFCFNTQKLKKCGGYYKLPLAWGSDDITVVRAAMAKGIANMQVIGFQYRKSCSTITSSGNPKIKLEAINLEKNWYRDFYASLDGNKLSELDGKYHSMLGKAIGSHFHMKKKLCLIEDINGSPTKLITHLLHNRDPEISQKLILYCWFDSFVHKK